MPRAVLSGAAGFLGSHLASFLIEKGVTVVGVDNLSTGLRGNVVELERSDRFNLIVHDISKPIEIEGAVDLVLHLASPASPHDFQRMPIQIMKVGGLGTHNMLGLAKAKGARFLLASTSEVYGNPLVHPQPETYWGNVNPVGKRAVYDESKRYAEALTMAYKAQHKVDTTIARIFNTYGPGMRLDDGRVVSNFILQALRNEPITIFGDGSQTRCFCYIDDLIDGIFRLVESSESGPMNLGSSVEITVRELSKLVIEAADSKSTVVNLELPQDDPVRRKPDLTLASSRLDWSAKIALEEGLERTVAHFARLLKAM